MNDILKYIDDNKNRYMDELVEFLKIPSISSDSRYNNDVLRCAGRLKEYVIDAGIEDVRMIETEGHPIVYAEWKGAGENVPTILIYGHYDVQPVDPLNLWTTPPFEPEIRGGKLFARGTADDKGQMFSHVKAIEAYMKTKGKLPVNIKLLFEGEEEAGSSNLEKFIQDNAEMLACDAALISDTEWFAEGVPSLCYGLRGVQNVEVTVNGPNRDLHSGSFGGAIDNPLNVLCDMISSLKDKHGRITIPGFYDNVLELTDVEREGFKTLPYDEKAYCDDLSIESVNGEIGFTTLERVWARPSLDLNGIYGGYTGEGSKTILPSKATAKISMRLVPHQTPAEVVEKIEKHLKSIAPPTVTIEFTNLHGGTPVLVERESKPVDAAMTALEKAFGKKPVFMREGGSIPVVDQFRVVLNVPSVLMGFGLPSDNIHSPNENYSVENYYGGIKTSALFLDEMSK
ncbi:MAG: dipeptidase [Candidatus Kapabacteria bacterium]|nr:dipeptidase [Candidatus Kapabacteria bacterium]